MFERRKMTLFFSLENLEKSSAGNSKLFLYQLWCHHTGKIQKHRNSKLKPSKISLHGNSWILKPDALFDYSSIDPAYLVQYIKLAARRSYSLYSFHGVKYLDLSFFPDISLEKIKTNPLIKINQNKIFFKYEENL